MQLLGRVCVHDLTSEAMQELATGRFEYLYLCTHVSAADSVRWVCLYHTSIHKPTIAHDFNITQLALGFGVRNYDRN